MREESAVENGPLVGAESTNGLGPTICQVLDNLIKINFRWEASESVPWHWFHRRKPLMKRWVSNHNSCPRKGQISWLPQWWWVSFPTKWEKKKTNTGAFFKLVFPYLYKIIHKMKQQSYSSRQYSSCSKMVTPKYPPTSFLSKSCCGHVCICMYVGTWVHMLVKAGGLTLDVLTCPPPYILRQSLLLKLQFIEQASLTAQLSPRICICWALNDVCATGLNSDLHVCPTSSLTTEPAPQHLQVLGFFFFFSISVNNAGLKTLSPIWEHASDN